MVTTKLNLSMTEPQVRQIYAKQGDTGRVLDITLDQTPEDGTLRILRPDGVEVTSEAVTGGEVESGGTFDSLTEADVTELSVGIEPVQDLNGYDKPWVGGAGKNLLPQNTSPSSINGVTFTPLEGGGYHVSGTATGSTYYTIDGGFESQAYPLPSYLKDGSTYVGTSNSNLCSLQTYLYGQGNYGNRASFTVDASRVTAFGAFIFVPTGTVINEDVYPQLELGSTATAWQPYSNICPITGHDEVRVYDDPVYDKTIRWNQLANIADASSTSASGITCTVENGHITYKGTVTQGANYLNVQSWAVAQSDFVVGHKYLFRVRDTIRQGYNRGLYFVINNPYVEIPFPDGTPMTFIYTPTALPTYCFLRVYIFTTVGQEIDGDGYVGVFDLTEMFGEGNEPTIEEFDALFPKDYYPYNAGEETTVSAVNGDPNRQYTTSLGQTVYGGTLDMVSGVLTVDKAMVTLDGSEDEGWLAHTKGCVLLISDAYNAGNSVDQRLTLVKCNTLEPTSWVGIGSLDNGASMYYGKGIIIKVDSVATVAEYREWLASNPTQIIYPLASPQTIQLTPQQIKTLVGTNNVWASSGDIVNIKFTYGGLLSELPSDATSIVGKCYCDVEQNGVSSMPFTLNVKKNERQ